MTEKIARRGVRAPDSYEPDPLERVQAGEVMHRGVPTAQGSMSAKELLATIGPKLDRVFVTDDVDAFEGRAYSGCAGCSG